jgi:hypothetical protein
LNWIMLREAALADELQLPKLLAPAAEASQLNLGSHIVYLIQSPDEPCCCSCLRLSSLQ